MQQLIPQENNLAKDNSQKKSFLRDFFFVFKSWASKNTASPKSILISILALFGIVTALLLVNQAQDLRQQAKFCDDDPESPYYDPSCLLVDSLTPSPTALIPTVSPASSNEDRPKTEANCSGRGFWLNDSCYLFWETLPGDTHVVVPPGVSGREYATLMPKDQAIAFQGSNPSPTPTSTPIVSSAPTTSVVYDFSIDGKCNPPFYIVGDKCVPNQRDSSWNSKWINATGCGAMQTLYYALQKNPNLNITTFLNTYYFEYMKTNVSSTTNTKDNINILEGLGYVVEPYQGVLAYHGEEITSGDSTIFIGALFGNSINHFASIDQVSHNSDGTTTLNMIDSYFGVDKCVSVRGQVDIYNCYNSKGEKITSIDLSTASVYVVSDNEI